MKKIIKLILTAVLLLTSLLPAAAQDDVYGSAGFKMIYSDDEDVSQTYYKPFAIIGWSGETIDISASYYRWMSYSITDELLESREIDINQPGADITVYAGDIFSFSGGYSFLSGSSDYSAHRVTGEIILDFEAMDISVDSSFKKTEYDFNGTIKNSAISAGGEISFDVTDNFSWDIGYQYEYTDYETYGYTYSNNTGRAGIVFVPMKNLFFLGGVSGGADSDDVISVAFDAGITLKLYNHLKLSAAYMLSADFISSDSTTTSTSRKGSSTSTSTSIETEISQTASMAVSLYF